jgi:hypothetical protein
MRTLKFFAPILLLSHVFFFLVGCKKGDGDPFLSLKSREARLAGEWTISAWNYNMKINSTSNNTSTNSSQGITYSYSSKYTRSQNYNLKIERTNFAISDDTFIESFQSNATSPNSESKNKYGSASGTATIEFRKDGTFSRKIEYSDANLSVNSTFVSAGNSAIEIYYSTESNVEITSGTWEFLDGIEGEYKNKERVILHIKSKKTNNTYSDNNGNEGRSSENVEYKDADNNEIWLLTALKNDEVVFEAETSYNSSNYKLDNSSTSSTTSNQSVQDASSGIGTIRGTLSK